MAKQKKVTKKKVVKKKVEKVDKGSIGKAKRKTALNKKKVLETLESNFGIVTSAIAKVGISNSIFYVWYRDDAEFAKRVDEIQSQFDIIVDDKIKQAIIMNDGSMIRFYASRKMKKYKKTIGIGQAEDLRPFKMMITVKKNKKND